MSELLARLGIPVAEPYAESNLKPHPDLVIVGNALSRGNVELEYLLDQRIPFTSLAAVIHDEFLRGRESLVVAGTHGKTTTTSMLAWIYETAAQQRPEFAPSFLIGGVAENFGTSFQLGDGKTFILEGDEYDTAFFDKRSKFVHYLPELVIINNLEFDHADIFENLAAIQKSFSHLVRIVPRNGMILVNADEPNALAVVKDSPAPILEVGFSENAAVRILDVHDHGDRQTFRLFNTEFTLGMSGLFNVRNAAMAIAAAHFYQIPLPEIAAAVAKFEGVKRRQEVRGEVRGVTIIDDFGHHPTAMRETLHGLRHRYPQRRIWALFEPRSNTTRRAVFQKDLPAALALADGVFVAQVAALEQIPPSERLHPEQVVADIQAAGVPAFYEPDADAIVARLNPLLKPGDVVVVFSNGGFGGIHQKLLAL
jgi:UDP-N-acetylmuramate: L-alanyl-gamma-D-glutamyl-meso-diaminopimelate ligase